MMWKKLWNFLLHGKKTTESKQSEERKPMPAAAQEPVCRQEEAPSKAPAEEMNPAPQAEQEEAPSKTPAEEEKPAPQDEQEEAPSEAPAEEEKLAPQAEQEEAPSEASAEEEKPAPQAEKKVRELTEEEKRRAAYTPEQLKPELVEKLSKDPEYAKMCMFCTNAPKLLTQKAEYLVPEHGRFKPCYVTFNHPMKIWDAIPFVAIGIDPVDGESKQALWVQIPFSLDSDRVMGKLMLTGTRQELMDYMNSPECGPQFMQYLDEINEALRNHD